MVTLSQQLKLLADGFRKRYGKTETLTLADMTKLVTPPAFPSGINLIKKPINIHNKYDYRQNSYSNNFDIVPPKMSKPITLTFRTESTDSLDYFNGNIALYKNDGNQLRFTIPNYQSGYESGKQQVHDFTIVIPANTTLASGKFTIDFSSDYDYGDFTITQVIATYVGGS